LLLLIGVALMALAPLVPWLPQSLIWTEADGVRYQQVSADFHAAGIAARQLQASPRGRASSGEPVDPVAVKRDYDRAQAAFAAQQARKERAERWPPRVVWLVRLLGIGFVTAGVWRYARHRAA
jgi:hypothetical protein